MTGSICGGANAGDDRQPHFDSGQRNVDEAGQERGPVLTVEPFFPPPGPLAKFVQQESAKMGTRHSDYTDRTTIAARVSLNIARANPARREASPFQLLDLML